jgi:benzoate-CoA ligase
MLERVPTAYDDRIYGADWRAWIDPQVPDEIAPTTLLLDRHLGTAVERKTALIVDGEPISYGELTTLVARVSTGLSAHGVAPEDRILLFGTDSLDYVAMWLGAVRAGAIPAVVSDLYKAHELLYFLRDTAARLCFIDAEQMGKLMEIADALPPSLHTIIIRGELPPLLGAQASRPPHPTLPPERGRVGWGSAGETPALPGGGRELAKLEGRKVLPFAAICDGHATTTQPLPRHRNDVSYMFFSGGTTGTAKGITHLAHDFVLVPERHGRFWQYRESDVAFATSKKYFTHGLWPGLLIPLYWGATAVLMRRPPLPEPVLRTMADAGVTKLITVPTVLKNILEHVRQSGIKPNFPALDFVGSASEKIPPEIFPRFHEQFGVELFDSIGSSEITYEWIANRQKEFKRGSLGKPIFGYEVRLMSADHGDVTEPNVPGEAWIKSKTACFFYWRKYDKSRETFIGEWTRTGDNLYFDEDGFFWFSGRNDDMFKVKGLWVAPIEIEAALTAHPAVREAAVVSFTDRDGFTKPKAYVVLRQGYAQRDALIAELCAAVRLLGGYKVPERYEFIDELPRTTLMKIDRRALRQLG